jgi:dipeptidyl aminopeptidase/acylaminoacyl peptidase
VRDFRWRLIAVAAIFGVSITLGMLVTQEGSRVPLRPGPLSEASGVYEFTWSPDSKSLAYVGTAGGGFDVWIVSSTGGDQPRRITSTLRYKKQPRWSGDGKWIAFISVEDDGNSDLRAVSVDGQSILTLTDTAAEESDPIWSPDSTRIAFTQRIGTESNIMAVELQSSVTRKLADGPASGLRWSPDGKWIAFVADLLQPRDERRENEDVFVVSAEGGTPRLLTPGTPRFRDAAPDWAPDSQHLVYRSEEGGYSNLYILDVLSGGRRALTTSNAENLSPRWAPDGTRVAYVRHENSIFHIYNISVEDRMITRISDVDGANGGYQSRYAGPPGMVEWSPDGTRIAFTHSDPGRTSDIWIGTPEGGRPVQLTDSMPTELRRESRFVWPDRIAYRSFDGQEISALVYKPQGRRPGSGYPALLYFRDTLDGEHSIAWDPIAQFLVSNGYLVFAPNIRGSGGYGHAYRELVAGHGGDHDVRDALFGLDRLSSEGLIDTERVGVIGAGTGGFLTTAALIRGELRFKAAFCINAIVDMVTATSYPETAEAARYMIGGNPIENPIPYYERSIVNFVDKLRTPIVFLYARHNPTAPFQQLEQFAVQAEVKGRWYDYRIFENESGDWRTWRQSSTRFALEAMEAVFEKYLLGRERDIRLSRNR